MIHTVNKIKIPHNAYDKTQMKLGKNTVSFVSKKTFMACMFISNMELHRVHEVVSLSFIKFLNEFPTRKSSK